MVIQRSRPEEDCSTKSLKGQKKRKNLRHKYYIHQTEVSYSRNRPDRKDQAVFPEVVSQLSNLTLAVCSSNAGIAGIHLSTTWSAVVMNKVIQITIAKYMTASNKIKHIPGLLSMQSTLHA